MPTVAFQKADDELQIVWAEAYVPGVPDAQDDFMTEVEVMKMAYNWMAKSKTSCVDTDHDNAITDAVVVESFIARKGDPDFIPGSWVVGVHFPSDEMWSRVKKGEINGFSIMGRATTSARVDMAIPGDVVGVTKSSEDHTHNFTVAYNDDGAFIGGITDVVDGHYHVIRKGTLTESSNGHCHHYDFVRGALDGANRTN
jgi:hypothetical protein